MSFHRRESGKEKGQPSWCLFFFLICFLLGYSRLGLPRWLSGKGSTCNAGDVGLIPGSEKCPRRKCLPGKSHRHRSLAIYSPWDHKVQFSSVQSLSHVQLFATPKTAARQASLSITNSRSLPKLKSWIYLSNHYQKQYRCLQRCVSFCCVRICISPPSQMSLPPSNPHPIHPGHHRAPSWAPSGIQQVPTSYRFYTW